MSDGRDRTGFTLLELLVAMALMAVLAGSLYASLNTAFRGRRTSERALEPARRAAAALDAMGRDLRAVLPPGGLLAGSFHGASEKGDDGEPADVLRFHALPRRRPADERFPVHELEFALAADSESDEKVLLRRVTANLLAPENPEPAQEVLCRRVRALDITFFDGVDWWDTWDSTTASSPLPLAVRASLKLEADGRPEGYSASRTFTLPAAPGVSGRQAMTRGGP